MRTVEEVCADLEALEDNVAARNRAYDCAADGSQAKHDAIAALNAASEQRVKLENELNAILGN
jgi:hypothetical protein